MALVSCWECGKEISQSAAACPHCGAPPKPLSSLPVPARKKQNPLNQNIGCGSLIALGVLAFLVYSIWNGGKESSSPPPAASAPAVSAAVQQAATAKFSGMPAISYTEWLDGDFIIAALDNGSSWQPVADSTCAWLRQQGAPAGMAVVILEASALRNKRWNQLARARCN